MRDNFFFHLFVRKVETMKWAVATRRLVDIIYLTLQPKSTTIGMIFQSFAFAFSHEINYVWNREKNSTMEEPE